MFAISSPDEFLVIDMGAARPARASNAFDVGQHCQMKMSSLIMPNTIVISDGNYFKNQLKFVFSEKITKQCCTSSG